MLSAVDVDFVLDHHHRGWKGFRAALQQIVPARNQFLGVHPKHRGRERAAYLPDSPTEESAERAVSDNSETDYAASSDRPETDCTKGSPLDSFSSKLSQIIHSPVEFCRLKYFRFLAGIMYLPIS